VEPVEAPSFSVTEGEDSDAVEAGSGFKSHLRHHQRRYLGTTVHVPISASHPEGPADSALPTSSDENEAEVVAVLDHQEAAVRGDVRSPKPERKKPFGTRRTPQA